MKRALFIADGSSDLPIARHVETLAYDLGRQIEVVPFPGDRFRSRAVADRVTTILREDSEFSMLLVHRDSETRDPSPRYVEVADGATAGGFTGPAVAVVPVRMTEAWLLLDEVAIRAVAGNPRGQMNLNLPTTQEAERLANAKDRLREALALASGLSGRRLSNFKGRFNDHRRQLLDRLDARGPVRQLSAWERLATDLSSALDQL